MPIPIYEKGHVVDCDIAPNLTTLKRKSVLITGGSSRLCKSLKVAMAELWLGADGLGETYVRAFASAG
jgi:NAD(P)-dependent dehydrogenase (short-subunit alcohol dehydrogenase family)